MTLKQFLLLLCLALVSITSSAGVVIEYVKRNVETGKEDQVQTMSIQNGMARMEVGGGAASSIFKNDSMYVLDHAAKKYRVIDKATMEQTAAAMDDAMAKMRAQMEKMPPEQRAMMEQMMKQRGGAMMAAGAAPKPATYDAQATGGSETIDGRSCKLWNVTRNGVLSEQLCVVPLSAAPGSDEALATWKKISAMFEKFGERFRGQVDTGMQQSTAILAKINGFPIMTRNYEDGKLSPDQFVIKSWKQQTVDAAKFEVPADYTKQEMPRAPRAP